MSNFLRMAGVSNVFFGPDFVTVTKRYVPPPHPLMVSTCVSDLYPDLATTMRKLGAP